ncbi:MAG: short-chain isoprenyl diphosphate synthase, partial [Lachnospiraceae bacterium]|nr:short-chain isoprenyl diphosphate synthase [Lachnospiraceae bacterium]
MTIFKKHLLFIFLCTFPILLFSSYGKQVHEISSPETPPLSGEAAVTEHEDSEHLVQLYQEIYEEAIQTGSFENLTIVQEIIRKLEKQGVTAIDIENQVDMANPGQMERFITALKNGETASLTVLIVSAYDRFTAYDLHANEGVLEAGKTYYQYEYGAFERKHSVSFLADSWQYTEEGYFLFTGKSFSAESLVLTMSDEEEFCAWRVAPLDAQCREWNRQYLLPVGYNKNNMFLIDWDEKEYGALDFYDIFDKFYPTVSGQPVPYTANENAAVGAVYHIPENEFENVVSLHLAVDTETLRTKTKYVEKDRAYEYHPRGFYEVEYPNLPYPEVVSGTENDDGTLTLLV